MDSSAQLICAHSGHWKVTKVLLNKVGTYVQLLLLRLSKESLGLLKRLLRILWINSMIDNIKEANPMRCLANLLRYSLAIGYIIVVYTGNINDWDLVGFNRRVGMEEYLLAVLERDIQGWLRDGFGDCGGHIVSYSMGFDG
jgi:hypothetical protein